MNTTYTAGPWRVENESAAENPEPGDSDIWIGTEGGGHSIAHIGRDPGLTHDQHMANARLIAKAPDLLEQLSFCCEQLAECMEQNHGRIWDNAQTVLANARTLLAALDGTEVRS